MFKQTTNRNPPVDDIPDGECTVRRSVSRGLTALYLPWVPSLIAGYLV